MSPGIVRWIRWKSDESPMNKTEGETGAGLLGRGLLGILVDFRTEEKREESKYNRSYLY